MAFQNSCVVPLGITATEYRLARFPVFPQFTLATAASNVRNKKYFFILAFLPIKMLSFLPEIPRARRSGTGAPCLTLRPICCGFEPFFDIVRHALSNP